MIRNFFIVAVRNFFKQHTQSILNVSGLAIGLACSMYVYLYALDELTFDTQHPDAENTYRLIWKDKGADGQENVSPWAILGWAHYMKENLKGVKSYSSLNTMGWPHSFYYTPENGEQRIVLSEEVLYATKNYPGFFYLDLVAGDKNKLFEEPTDIVISESAARELFGNESPLNKQLEFAHPSYLDNAKTSLVVTGVFRDMPYNMQYGRTTKYLLNRAIRKLPYETWSPNESFENSLTSMWWPAYSGSIYFQTEPQADLNYLREQLKIEINKVASAKLNEPSSIEPEFIKITETHFSDIPNLIWPELQGNRQYIYIFLTIGGFILLISCINYTNLATARSMRRAKEVGVRKVMGSYKKQLIFQFLQEAFLVTGLSVIVALIIAVVLLPYFSEFANKDLAVSDLFSVSSLLMILLLWISVSIFSGLYPAFYMASMQTIKVLKGGATQGKRGNLLRQGLMVFQFSISFILIVFTLVVITQMNDMINNDLNKAGDQILGIRYGNAAPVDKLNVFRNELARNPDLSISSFGHRLPRREGFVNLSHEVTLPDKTDQKYSWDMMFVGPTFHKVYDLEVIAGRFFDISVAMDSTEVLVNEEAAKQLNVDAEELIGQQITVKHPWTQKEYNLKVRGVLKNFKYKSVHTEISPLILTIQKGRAQDIVYYIKLPAGNIQENVAAVEQVWKKVMPEDAGMSHWFISDEYNSLYFEENALHDLSRVFTVLGILTTCIGLFGMSMFLAERRSREMSIRKVMGAGSTDIFKKMVAPFFKMMIVSCSIGLPVAYYFSTKWLDNFIYKVQWSWMTTVIPILLILVITLFTVSFQSFKSARANPVNSLKE